MVRVKLKAFVIPLILINLVVLTTFSTGNISNLKSFPKMSNPPMDSVIIDGVINASEWADADWKIDFYLDVDNPHYQ